MPEIKVKKLALIACKVLWREFSFFAGQSEAVIDSFFQPQGLHNDPENMRAQIQAVINQVEAEHNHDYLIFGYGLCSRGIEGLKSRKTPMVFARAHDCLTFLLGSRQRQIQIYREHPDAYWYSPGWIETGTQPSKERIEKEMELLRMKFGEEDARWLHSQMAGWNRNYHKAIYIDFKIGDREKYLAYTRACAEELGWEFIELEGDPALVKNLLSGQWDEKNFLILPPGQELKLSYDDDLVKCSIPCQG